MNKKELTKTFYDDFKLEKPFGLHGLYKINSALEGLTLNSQNTDVGFSSLNQITSRLKGYFS